MSPQEENVAGLDAAALAPVLAGCERDGPADTGAAVPLYSNAEGLDRIPPFIQQPELFGICMEYLGLGE